MSSTEALDLVYRPRKFADVIGNESVIKLLLTRSRQGTLDGRSMMFGGSKGCGKTTMARIVARAIVCDNLNDGEPCDSCESCNSITDESSVSFDEYDAATQGTVDRVRALLSDLDFGSFDGKPRVVILDEAHRLSKGAQDALLKAMEDRRLVIILCTTEPRKIVEAIRTRVEEYPVSPPSEDAVVSLLRRVCKAEKIPADVDALLTVAKSLKNCPRECVCAIDTLRTLGGVNLENAKQLFRYDRLRLIGEVLQFIDSDPRKSFALLDELSVEGASWVRDQMVNAIASSLRHAVGARSSFPVDVSFFESRGMNWAILARSLGALDRPAMSDIESALLSTLTEVVNHSSAPARIIPKNEIVSPSPSHPEASSANPASVQTSPAKSSPIPQNPAPAPVAPKPTPAAKTEVVKDVRPIEIDGVKFSPKETLTSIDHKIDKPVQGPPVEAGEELARVEYDKRNVPLPQKEFSSSLLRRVKSVS